jgi:hypothetical protein
MIQYDQIVVVGCSYTWGDEILGVGTHDPRGPSLAWAGKLAQMLNCPVRNLSACGISNDLIYWSLMDHLLGNVDALVQKKTLVIVQWTYWDRIHVFKPGDPNKHTSLYAGIVSPGDLKFKPLDSPIPWTRALSGVYTDYLGSDPRTVLNVVTASNLIKTLIDTIPMCDFFYWNVEPLRFVKIPDTFDPQLYQFSRGSLLNPHRHWADYMKKICENSQSGWHYTEQANDLWAQQVYQYLETGQQIG